MIPISVSNCTLTNNSAKTAKVVSVSFVTPKDASGAAAHGFGLSVTLRPGQSGRFSRRVIKYEGGNDMDFGAGVIPSCYVHEVQYDDGTYIIGPTLM
jgi:hypothetical protein